MPRILRPSGDVAQSGRASRSQCEGRGFEPLRLHHRSRHGTSTAQAQHSEPWPPAESRAPAQGAADLNPLVAAPHGCPTGMASAERTRQEFVSRPETLPERRPSHVASLPRGLEGRPESRVSRVDVHGSMRWPRGPKHRGASVHSSDDLNPTVRDLGGTCGSAHDEASLILSP